jgi:hypothetical protein
MEDVTDPIWWVKDVDVVKGMKMFVICDYGNENIHLFAIGQYRCFRMHDKSAPTEGRTHLKDLADAPS